MTPTDTLRALQQRRRAWHNVEWTARTVIQAETLGTTRVYDLVGGVFAEQKYGPDFNVISLAQVADIDQAQAKYTLGIDFEDFQDFAMDPTQNLLVVFYQRVDELAHLECRTLSSQQVHPLAPLPLFPFPLDRDPSKRFSVQIADDVIALSFPEKTRLVLLN